MILPLSVASIDLVLALNLALAVDRALGPALAVDRAIYLNLGLSYILDRVSAPVLGVASASASALELARELTGKLGLGRAHELAHDLASALARENARVLKSDSAVNFTWAPDATETMIREQVSRLHQESVSAPHWTRLTALSGLLALGAGTPEICAKRNVLLDWCMANPASVTFPGAFGGVVTAEEVPTILRIVFLHEPGSPLVEPEWYRPDHELAPYLRATPREFYALAASALDPKKETGLAQWYLPREEVVRMQKERWERMGK